MLYLQTIFQMTPEDKSSDNHQFSSLNDFDSHCDAGPTSQLDLETKSWLRIWRVFYSLFTMARHIPNHNFHRRNSFNTARQIRFFNAGMDLNALEACSNDILKIRKRYKEKRTKTCLQNLYMVLYSFYFYFILGCVVGLLAYSFYVFVIRLYWTF